MSTTEWFLVALVFLIPAVIAVVVTLWSLEQVLLRSRRNRNRKKDAPAGEDEQPDDAPSAES